MYTVTSLSFDDIESLLAGGARALVDDGDLLASRQRFDAAYRVAERTGDARAVAVAALGLGGLWVHEHRTAAAAALMHTRLRYALSLVNPQSWLALRLRARLAGESDYRVGEHAAILAVLDETRQAADPVARAEALSLAHHCLLGPEHGVVRRPLAIELIGESCRTARRSDLLMGLLWQTVDLFLDAEPHAERRLGELRDLLAQGDHLAVGFVVSAIEVMLTIRAGRFDAAEALAHACAQRGAAAGDIDAMGWHGAQLVAIRWYQGRLVELLPMLDELVHSPSLSAVDNSYFAALAVAAAKAGDERKAAGALATLCGRDLAELPRSSTWLVTMNGIVEAAHLLDDADTSARAYELLSAFARLPMMASLGVACFGSVHHALGVASLTTGDVDRAVEHLRAAVHRNLAMAHWPAVMTSRLRYAQALALRTQPQDAAIARRELATATEEATALGITLRDNGRLSASPRSTGHDEPLATARPYLSAIGREPAHPVPSARRTDGGGLPVPGRLQLGILGPLELWVGDTEASLGSAKLRALLAALALQANRVVTAPRLLSALWDGSAPASARKNLHSYVHRLRRLLSVNGAAERLHRHPYGYTLEVGSGELDLHRFESLVTAARHAVHAGDPDRAVTEYRNALALWRGPALADVADTGPLAEAARQLDERRLTVLEEHAQAGLELGQAGALLGDIEALVAAYPMRERLREQLMLALYQLGRTADALAIYQDARHTFAAELGIEPGSVLRRLEQAILRGEPVGSAAQPVAVRGNSPAPSACAGW